MSPHLPSCSLILTHRRNSLLMGRGGEILGLKPHKKQKLEKIIDKRLEKYVDLAKLESLYTFEKAAFDRQEVEEIVHHPEECAQHLPVNRTILMLMKHILIQVQFFNRKDGSAIPKFIEDRQVSISTLITSMFDFGEGGIFKLLLFDCLSKMPVTVEQDQPTSLDSGRLANFIVELSEDRDGHMYIYNKIFHRLLASNFEVICKLMLNFYILKDDQGRSSVDIF